VPVVAPVVASIFYSNDAVASDDVAVARGEDVGEFADCGSEDDSDSQAEAVIWLVPSDDDRFMAIPVFPVGGGC